MNEFKQYEDFKATALYCSNCHRSMPVRERLLLVLPDGYLYEYLCLRCREVVGEKKVKLNNQDRLMF